MLLSSCGLTGQQVLHNTLVGAQLTTDVSELVKAYPNVISIIEKHKDFFTNDELDKLAKSKELIDYAIVEVLKLKNIRSLATIPDIEKLYRNLMFIWGATRKVYETNSTIIISKYDKFSTMEMLAINDLDSVMRDINFNLEILFDDGVSGFNESKAKEVIPILMDVIKVVASLAVVI
jgi:predicted house-cleaning noncanonical NTP pyrophosphatase (MazG superfamily)